jgi:hypothetical protein
VLGKDGETVAYPPALRAHPGSTPRLDVRTPQRERLLDARSDRILGFTMFGPEAGEVVPVVQTAMLAGLPYTGLHDAILAHLTMAEGLRYLFAAVSPRSAP